MSSITDLAPCLAIAGAFLVAACSQASTTPSTGASAAGQPPAVDHDVAKNLATFDDLDFNVFTHQKWDELSRSHSKDYAPDTRILFHPVKFGSGEWTSVISDTISQWNKNGTMDEEYLFWDNATYTKQIGLAK